jgi:hypothetical protein
MSGVIRSNFKVVIDLDGLVNIYGDHLFHAFLNVLRREEIYFSL